MGVETAGHFPAEGQAGEKFTYMAKVKGDVSEAELEALVRATDKVAECTIP